jgi:diguanylate cyclase (GGDEF)-like protein/PAS domain S-box-containing protein
MPVEGHARLIELDNRKFILSVNRDITERKQAEEKLRKAAMIIDAMADGVTVYDMQGRITRVNKAATIQHGYNEEEVIGKTPADVFISEKDIPYFLKQVEDMNSGKQVGQFEYLSKRKDGAEYPTSVNLSAIRDSGGNPTEIVAVHRDITEQKKMEERISRYNNALKVIKDVDMMVSPELDKSTLINYSCNLLSQTGSYSNVWVLLLDDKCGFVDVAGMGGDIEELSIVMEHMKREDYPVCISEVLGQDDPLIVVNKSRINALHKECPLYGADGAGASLVKRLEFGGKLQGVMGVTVPPSIIVDDHEMALFDEITSDISVALSRIEAEGKRQQMEVEIAYAAEHDSLTDLPNRMLFIDRLAVALACTDRNQHRLAVLMLDLDKFKRINDDLGHSAGDLLLKIVGKRLTGVLRSSDTVARMGGDEFVILLPAIKSEKEAVRVAQKLVDAFKTPFAFDGHERNITASIGIATYPEGGKDVDALIKNADTAMYMAKEYGRNNYQLYEIEKELTVTNR